MLIIVVLCQTLEQLSLHCYVTSMSQKSFNHIEYHPFGNDAGSCSMMWHKIKDIDIDANQILRPGSWN